MKNIKLFYVFGISAAMAFFISVQLFSPKPELKINENKNHIENKKTYGVKSLREQRIEENKMDSPNLFVEFMRGIRTKDNEKNPGYAQNYRISELQKAINKSKLFKQNDLNWIERGPANVSGRTRSIIVDPDDNSKNTWIAGSVGGGIWKTTDAGNNWEEITSGIPNFATSVLVMSQSNHNVIYAGTGEGFNNVDQIDGSGIWKSTDRGNSWSQLTSTVNNSDFQNITRIIVSDSDENLLLASTTSGFHYNTPAPDSKILRSNDGGISWNTVYTSTSSVVQQLIADPGDFNIQYASINGEGVIKSIDGGITWNDASIGIAGGGRFEIAIAPSDPNKIYLSAEGGATGSQLFVSNNKAESWYPSKDINQDFNWLGGQGWYDNTITVNPYDPNEVFVGGVNLWKINVSDGVTNFKGIIGTEKNDIGSFWTFVNATGSDFDLGGFLAENFFGATETQPEDYVSIELRFGPGKGQKAHRYLRQEDGSYLYQDYVDIPFELWDIDNNRQLMIGFRDSENNGVYDLEDRATAVGGLDREYLFISSIDYSAQPDTNLTSDFTYKNIYGLWPEAPTGVGSVDFSSVPESNYRINYGEISFINIETTNITDSYAQYGGTSKGVHPDQHNITIVKINESEQTFRMVVGNDGGVYYSDDKGETFNNTLNGYNTTQFYGVDKMNGGNRYIGGTQDNGSWVSPVNPDQSSAWIDAPSGDGFEAVWNYGDVNKMMESSQYNSIYRTLDGGNNWENTGTSNGLEDVGSSNAPFYTKLASSQQDPELVFALGVSGVWRTDNFGDNWDLITIGHSGWNGTSSFSHIEVSLADQQVVWAGFSMSASSPIFVSTDGGVTFNPTNVYSGTSLGRITGIVTHPTDKNTAYILFSFAKTLKILKTSDLGQTWNDISGFGNNKTSSSGFPDVAVYSLIVMPYNTDIIWAGTEIGLFESTDSGNSWHLANNGLPPVSIFNMKIVNNQVVLATHGRGIWTVDLPELESYKPALTILAPRIKSAAQGITGANIEVRIPSKFDSSFVLINNEKFAGFNSSFLGDTLLTYMVSEEGNLDIQVAGYSNNSVYISPVRELIVHKLNEPANNYLSDFDNNTDDFYGNGFEIKVIDGFSKAAIHSEHPYSNQNTFTYTLKTPIRVSGTNSKFTYKDIALVEPGEEGSSFGNSEFYDYVVVEATKDGINWIPLLDGYDADYSLTWRSFYDKNTTPDDSYYAKHTVYLADKFSLGDFILIRFRLFADPGSNGWGWVISEIKIQESVVGVDNNNNLPNSFSLEQNYPNPFNPGTTINFSIPSENKVVLKIYDILGSEVAILSNQVLKAGYHSINWNAANFASGVYIYKIESGNFVDIKKMILLK